MRNRVLLSFLLCVCPMLLMAQSAKELLPKVADALSAGKDDYAVSLFRQSAAAGIDQAEMFYWTSVDKNSAAAPRLAQLLAARYQELRSYDKAYLFYQELLQHRPQEISSLVSCAEMEMMRGETKDALKLYEKVLQLEPNNLQTNIFLGNYYYLQAEDDKKRLDEEYKKIHSPTKMQHARYRNNLADLLNTNYSRAKNHLERVVQLFPSIEANKTLERIMKMERETNMK